MKYAITVHSHRALAVVALCLVAGCRHDVIPDAYGNFEATEVTVSAQTTGQLETFLPSEGMQLSRGSEVALVDTTQLALQRRQASALRASTDARTEAASRQMQALIVQRDIAQRAYERTKRLRAEQAATVQQLDQAQRDYGVLVQQIDAARAQTASSGMDAAASRANVAAIEDHIVRSRVSNPVAGTVLVTYARAGEVVQAGTPLYKLANLDTLVLRAYVSEQQLRSFRIGQGVSVHVDAGKGGVSTLPGVVIWVSSSAEFTPTPVQTRDERADLVYAVKILVPNRDGSLKIGMPADVTLTGAKPERSPGAVRD